ncbi:unnamed protein product [Paramecium sonneborni]|uniref:Uncharacterized protein n=1 Tax=Paramecium sonneborni TaxID=65129 RepID=A0A8S1KZM9_9CILI|nr:unnamed protein product [Paramecium sonneborni]
MDYNIYQNKKYKGQRCQVFIKINILYAQKQLKILKGYTI